MNSTDTLQLALRCALFVKKTIKITKYETETRDFVENNNDKQRQAIKSLSWSINNIFIKACLAFLIID